MADVVGKTIFSDGKGKLFFGYYKTDDSVQFVDYKTWKKLSFKDVSKGDTNKERVIKAILKNQKQFNKKVEFNMWAKQKKRTFEETMDWFIQNGWINNINKGGIKESIDVLSVNEGKKRFYQQDNIGSSKYTINYHDGKSKNRDGSDFYGIKIFKNKKDLETFRKELLKKGYREDSGSKNESVNESFKPSQVRSAISKVKKGLMKKWAQKGGYENFGDKEGRVLRDKFNFNPYGSSEEREIARMIQGFENWAMNYDGSMREGLNEAKFGYKQSTASYINKHNNEYKIAERMNKGNERKFYDDLQAMEDKIGYPKTMKFISNALRGYGVDMFKDPKIKNPADAQEALFLLSK